MEELETLVLGIKIKYKFKPKKYDNNHLIVVLSGFGVSNEFTYDFESSLQVSQSNILWIKDDFGGHCSYYLCNEMNFSIEKAIIYFIDDMLSHLGLDKTQCSIIGFSKGGSAALYYGLKYNFQNILMTVPQLLIGSYVKKNWSPIANHMMGSQYTQAQVSLLDELLPNLLQSDVKLDRNIYVITSKADEQYQKELHPYLEEFSKYSNSNFILSKSIFVRQHNQVTSHHASFILGLCALFSNNVSPRLGYTILQGEKIKLPKIKDYEPIIKIDNLNLVHNMLYVEGVAILRGAEFKEYSDVQYKLRLINIKNKLITDLPLAKGYKPHLTKEYYNGDFIIYDKAWVTTSNNQGLDLAHLKMGHYKLFILINAVKENVIKEVPLIYKEKKILKSNLNTDKKEISLIASTSSVELQVS